MGTVVLPKLSQTGTNEWSDVEDNDKALRDEINGNLENVNIKSSAAIAHSKLANITAGYVLLGNASNVPTATAVTGDVTISSSGVTALGDDTVGPTELIALPAARAASTSDTSVATATATAIALAGETYDTDSMHSNVTNNSRMTITTAGIYTFAGEATLTSVVNADTVCFVRIRINGSGYIAAGSTTIQSSWSLGDATINVAGQYSFSASDYIELVVTQSGGGTETFSGKLAISYIGPAS